MTDPAVPVPPAPSGPQRPDFRAPGSQPPLQAPRRAIPPEDVPGDEAPDDWRQPQPVAPWQTPVAPWGSQPPTSPASALPADAARYALPPLPVQVPVEHIGRGIALSLLAVAAGVVLSAVLYQLGFIASITSFLMSAGAVWLYTRGAGSAPRKGIVWLVVVIVAGVGLSLLAMLGWGMVSAITAEVPEIPTTDAIAIALQHLFDGELWSDFSIDALIFIAFAALGTWGTIRQLRSAHRSLRGVRP